METEVCSVCEAIKYYLFKHYYWNSFYINYSPYNNTFPQKSQNLKWWQLGKRKSNFSKKNSPVEILHAFPVLTGTGETWPAAPRIVFKRAILSSGCQFEGSRPVFTTRVLSQKSPSIPISVFSSVKVTISTV